jgi:hypothetical protein
MSVVAAVLREFNKAGALHAPFHSPAATPLGAPIGVIPCTPASTSRAGANQSKSSDELATTRLSVLVNLPSPPPDATGVAVCPVAVDASAAATALVLRPVPWPLIDADMALAIISSFDASSSATQPAAHSYVAAFPPTSNRPTACRSFAPLDVTTFAFPSALCPPTQSIHENHTLAVKRAQGKTIGATFNLVLNDAWISAAVASATGRDSSSSTLFFVVFYATVRTTDFTSIVRHVAERSRVLEEKQQARAKTLAEAGLTSLASSSGGTAAVATAFAGMPAGKRMCPEDKTCAKLANATHIRLFMHTCRADGGPAMCRLRHDAKHTSTFFHPTDTPSASGVDADDDAAIALVAATPMRMASAKSASEWYDASDPWAIRPRHRTQRRGAEEGEISAKQASNSSNANVQAVSKMNAAAFSSDDEAEDRGAMDDTIIIAADTSDALVAGGDSALSVLESRVSLRDPLSFQRIQVPAKGRRCRHDASFDLATFIAHGARRSTWNCPVCDAAALVDDLRVDALLSEALAGLSMEQYEAGVDAVIISGQGNGAPGVSCNPPQATAMAMIPTMATGGHAARSRLQSPLVCR